MCKTYFSPKPGDLEVSLGLEWKKLGVPDECTAPYQEIPGSWNEAVGTPALFQ